MKNTKNWAMIPTRHWPGQPKNKKLQTEEPLAEKDEVKQAEEQQRKQMTGKQSGG